MAGSCGLIFWAPAGAQSLKETARFRPPYYFRPCLKNVKTPKRRIFFHHSALYFFAGLTDFKSF